MLKSANTSSLKNKYIKNFNPKFINDYFNYLNNTFHIIEYNNNDISYSDLDYNNVFYNKYLNCLLYCYTYLDNMMKFLINLPNGLYINIKLNIDDYIDLKTRVKRIIKKDVNREKKEYYIKLLIIAHKDVNRFYNNLKIYLMEK